MTALTMQQAQAESQAAALQIAEIELGIIDPLTAVINETNFAPIIQEIDDARAALISGHVYEQLGHLRTTLVNLPVNLTARVAEINSLLAPPPPPSEEP